MLAERVFAHHPGVVWVPCSAPQVREALAHGRADATVWNLDEVPGQLGAEVQVLPLGDELTHDLAVRHTSAVLIGRTGEAAGAGALAAVRDAVDLPHGHGRAGRGAAGRARARVLMRVGGAVRPHRQGVRPCTGPRAGAVRGAVRAAEAGPHSKK